MASEAAYRAGDIYYQKVAVIRLDGTKQENDGRIKGMQENLLPAIQYYAKAVQFAEEEWALRATLRMGDLFSTIALISDNQRVAGLSGDDRFRVNIGAKASVPDYLDKAAGIYQKNLEIGLSQNIESPWIDTAGTRLMETYVFKGRTLEELAGLFLQVPLPDGGTPDDIAQAKEQLKKASDEQLAKAIDTYNEALKVAQTYYLDNAARSQIVSRLRALDPNSPALQLQVPPKPAMAPASDNDAKPDAKPASVPQTQGHSKG
jgi:tetratricopeptide (TPR) repeat protein